MGPYIVCKTDHVIYESYLQSSEAMVFVQLLKYLVPPLQAGVLSGVACVIRALFCAGAVVLGVSHAEDEDVRRD